MIFDHSHIDFLEIIGEHFLGEAHFTKRELHDLMDEYTLIPHFIGLSLGSAEGINEEYLEKVATLIEKINPPYWSEHIAFTECRGLNIGHFTPVPYSQEALDVFNRNIKKYNLSSQLPSFLKTSVI